MKRVHPPTSPRSPRNNHNYVFNPPVRSSTISEITLSLANGMDIHLVHPAFFKDLIPYAKHIKKSMEKQGNTPAAKSLEKSIDYMENYAAGFTSTAVIPHIDVYMPNPNDVQYNVSLAMDSKDYESVDPDLYSNVVHEIKKIGNDAINENEYSRADETVHAIKTIRTLDDILAVEIDTEAKIDRCRDQLDDEREEYLQSKEEWERRIAETEAEKENELRSVNEKERAELLRVEEEFVYEKGWRPSPYYISLQHKQSHLMLTRRYNEAALVRDEIKKLEKEERSKSVGDGKVQKRIQKRDISKKYMNIRNAIEIKYNERIHTKKAHMEKELSMRSKHMNILNERISSEEKFILASTSSPRASVRMASMRERNVPLFESSAPSSPYCRTESLPLLNTESEGPLSPSQYKMNRKIGVLMFTRTPLHMSGPASPRRRGCLYD